MKGTLVLLRSKSSRILVRIRRKIRSKIGIRLWRGPASPISRKVWPLSPPSVDHRSCILSTSACCRQQLLSLVDHCFIWTVSFPVPPFQSPLSGVFCSQSLVAFRSSMALAQRILLTASCPEPSCAPLCEASASCLSNASCRMKPLAFPLTPLPSWRRQRTVHSRAH